MLNIREYEVKELKIAFFKAQNIIIDRRKLHINTCNQ